MRTGLLDTSVILEWDDPAVIAGLPDESSISALTLAELSAGPQLSADPAERARRQSRVQQLESLFDPLPFDAVAARTFAEIVSAARPRSQRRLGLFIAAIARANRLALYTRHGDEFAGLDSLLQIVII